MLFGILSRIHILARFIIRLTFSSVIGYVYVQKLLNDIDLAVLLRFSSIKIFFFFSEPFYSFSLLYRGLPYLNSRFVKRELIGFSILLVN